MTVWRIMCLNCETHAPRGHATYISHIVKQRAPGPKKLLTTLSVNELNKLCVK
jgi:hypothetical protein